ncbi:MAG TPA: PASTA domain-containing protein [Terriglobia bacterium]|nr:PASTA domain-containing protein [Terriglobia bacterium]
MVNLTVMPMRLADRIRMLFRLFLLFTFLAAIAVISAITTIRLTINGNQETLPNMVGVNMDTAETLADGMGLTVKVDDKLFSSKYPANQIISQEPPPDTRVKAGQHIHVLVSLGAPRIVAPNLVGTSVRVAQIVAVQHGLTVGDVAGVYWQGSEVDQIVAQDPPTSSAQLHSPDINFLVSLGAKPPAYVCPNFVGMQVDQARSVIQAGGFMIGHVNPVIGSTAPVGAIVGQSPQPGSKILGGDSFTFQVAQ